MLSGSMERIRNALGAMRASLWLIPGLMSIAAAVAARLMVGIELEGWLGEIDAWWLFTADAEVARDLLSTLLSAMISMTALVVSVTMVVLTLAANQLGPRLIWNFLRDRRIQAVLGIFFGTIFYILVVIRSVAAPDPPQIAVTVASAMVGVCLFALLFHVHRVARAIIADTVMDEVADELMTAIRALPEAGEAEEGSLRATPDVPLRIRVAAGKSGYLQVAAYGKLVDYAAEHDLLIRLRQRPGHFLLAGQCLADVSHRDPAPDDLAEALRAAVVIGHQRTPTQDLEYSVRQLVEIAVRALSPGISDPFTAIGVVHKLGAAVELLQGRVLPPADRLDDNGTLRLIASVSTTAGIVDAAFDQIRQAATDRGDVAVLVALARLLGQLGAITPPGEASDALRRQLTMLARSGPAKVVDEADRADLGAACRDALAGIGTGTGTAGRSD